MPASLPHVTPAPSPPARRRSTRRAFHPAHGAGPYKLPREVQDRLTVALAPFRNREAAFALATFLARYWSMPGKVIGSFHIDRRALAGHRDLGLTEARVRGAIRTLEEVGFLDRALAPSGSRYQATEDGLHRKPILFVFGSNYAPAFIAANTRAAVARGAVPPVRRSLTPTDARRASTDSARAPGANSPKSKSAADPKVNLGEFGADMRAQQQDAAASLLALRERLANLSPVRLSDAAAKGFRDRKRLW